MANALKPGVFDLDEMDNTHVRCRQPFSWAWPGPRSSQGRPLDL